MSRDALTQAEERALEHVRERVSVDGSHDVDGCPRFSRARCKFRHELAKAAAKGYDTAAGSLGPVVPVKSLGEVDG